MSVEQPVNFFEAMQLAKRRQSEPRQQLVVHDGPQAGGSVNAWSEAINNPKDADALLRSANARAASSWFTAVDAAARGDVAATQGPDVQANRAAVAPDPSLVQVRA